MYLSRAGCVISKEMLPCVARVASTTGKRSPTKAEILGITRIKEILLLASLRTHAMVLEPPCTLESFLPQLKPTEDSLSLVAAAGAEPLTKHLQIGLQDRSSSRSTTPFQYDHKSSHDGAYNTDHLRDHDSDHGGVGKPQGKQPPQGLDHVVLLVGPEGDWTAEELVTMVDAGASPVGLGPLRLRTETAAISLLAATSNLLLRS
eukprot:760866-Pelagomonas_calceolata.AAC.3